MPVAALLVHILAAFARTQNPLDVGDILATQEPHPLQCTNIQVTVWSRSHSQNEEKECCHLRQSEFIYQPCWISLKCSKAKLCVQTQTMQNSFACKTAKSAFTIHWAPEAASYHVSGSRWGVSTDGPTDWLTVPHEIVSEAEVQKWATLLGHGDGPPFKPTPSTTVEEALWCNTKNQIHWNSTGVSKNLAMFFAMCCW